MSRNRGYAWWLRNCERVSRRCFAFLRSAFLVLSPFLRSFISLFFHSLSFCFPPTLRNTHDFTVLCEAWRDVCVAVRSYLTRGDFTSGSESGEPRTRVFYRRNTIRPRSMPEAGWLSYQTSFHRRARNNYLFGYGAGSLRGYGVSDFWTFSSDPESLSVLAEPQVLDGDLLSFGDNCSLHCGTIMPSSFTLSHYFFFLLCRRFVIVRLRHCALGPRVAFTTGGTEKLYDGDLLHFKSLQLYIYSFCSHVEREYID